MQRKQNENLLVFEPVSCFFVLRQASYYLHTLTIENGDFRYFLKRLHEQLFACDGDVIVFFFFGNCRVVGARWWLHLATKTLILSQKFNSSTGQFFEKSRLTMASKKSLV